MARDPTTADKEVACARILHFALPASAPSPKPQRQAQPRPTRDQAWLVRAWKEMRESYRDYNTKGNSSAADETARAFFADLPSPEDWVATVQMVIGSGDGAEARLDADGIRYRLYGIPSDKRRELAKGQRVRFSGRTAGEVSLTLSGGVMEPELRINSAVVEILSRPVAAAPATQETVWPLPAFRAGPPAINARRQIRVLIDAQPRPEGRWQAIAEAVCGTQDGAHFLVHFFSDAGALEVDPADFGVYITDAELDAWLCRVAVDVTAGRPRAAGVQAGVRRAGLVVR